MSKRIMLRIGIGAELLLLLFAVCFWNEKKVEQTFHQKISNMQTTFDEVEKAEAGQNEEDKAGAGQNEGDKAEPDTQAKDTGEGKQEYIKWVEFNVTCEALRAAYTYDVESYGEKTHVNWVELLAYLGAKYGGDFKSYRKNDLDSAVQKIQAGETTMEELTKQMQYYPYYREAYGAVLDGMVGEYEIEQEEAGEKVWKKFYGLKAFTPIAKGFPYSDYDDFGVSRSYGYKRNHLGHDMMGQVGTPVIAMQSGYVAALGWNQYGGWRIGINSFDGRQYFYYAHLRQNRPFAEGLKEGDVVQAGQVIGYMGRTGYSTTENVNNIDTSHLHFGMQLIFDESQREGNHEIWINVYPLIQFLSQNSTEVLRNDASKEWYRKYEIRDPAAEQYKIKNSH